MAKIGVIADDFTGTASSGVLVAKTQAKTGLFFDPEVMWEFQNADQLDAIYVSSSSRHMPPKLAYEEVKKATLALKKMKISQYSKKIDTTLRGGIGYEIDAMLDVLGSDIMAVMVTAMPQSKRICVGGFSIIDGVILTETPVAHDVKTPIKECYVPELISNQSKHKVGLVNLKEVLKGKENLKQKFQNMREQGNRIIIVDAITMENVDTIAVACVELKWKILGVDPGPFTMKLAYHYDLITEEKTYELPEFHTNPRKTALLIVGTTNPQTKIQIDRLCRTNAKCVKISVSPQNLVSNEEGAYEINRVCNAIYPLFDHQNQPEAVIVETGLHESVMNLADEDEKRHYMPGTCSEMINEGLAIITRNILEEVGQDSIAGLLLTGGDTMERVCRRIGVSCIQALDNIVAQVDVGRTIGTFNGLPLIVKGGFCGYDDIEIDIVKRLFQESEMQETENLATGICT